MAFITAGASLSSDDYNNDVKRRGREDTSEPSTGEVRAGVDYNGKTVWQYYNGTAWEMVSPVTYIDNDSGEKYVGKVIGGTKTTTAGVWGAITFQEAFGGVPHVAVTPVNSSTDCKVKEITTTGCKIASTETCAKEWTASGPM